MKKFWLLAALLSAAATQAQAASFDCQKAKLPDEKAICAHRPLNDKDVEMATTYRLLKGLFAMGARGAMQDSQQEWLKQRQACKSNIVCLTKRYDERLQALQKIYDGIDRPL
ncbi:hypothetical protein TUM12370_22850 [Salmonella enterica subsp. enterica serovar Choleraesuis]|nr:hypothetical protein TUM12370_22850 [Salmonella enterica subsp. enterica serovar Choleraesuis]